ncbi:4'-phosphopantetheinyl transferase superfamily protein [Cyanobium sp. A1C-AMD]|uniref:4'-phosphopantetheinyl transferase family protein n=1 Tax=Cyanobium sp. A1C-AMD TaxID=2823694 RepID=UPI0020CD8FDB|nr:4'-phosphopantetheinyl transferase superfamily protein [Cyanobium sp. A1C-AMD]MCP9879711.1 4'-phosphopantetheinyl transferase superfamily protein [Cyanobium sp. A1C-AMD]
MDLPQRPAPQLWLRYLEGGDLGCLSTDEWSWGLGLPELQRSRYFQSRALLRQQLADVLGCAGAAVPLHSPPGLPPLLGNGLGWVSLSHSGAGLLIGYSGYRIGVDLESTARPIEPAGLMRRFYPELEQAQLGDLTGEELRRAVLNSWVLKEAAIKWRHRTLAAELSQWCYDHTSGSLQNLSDGAKPDHSSALQQDWRWAAVGEGCAGLMLQSPGQPEELMGRQGA